MIIKTLSVIVPVYNEEKTVESILNKIKEVELINNIDKEIIVVDDYSTDNTQAIVEEYISNANMNIKYYRHESNLGKGMALRTGIGKLNGEFFVVQDADLEYNPEEFNDLLEPIVNGYADVVYGSRFKGSKPHRILFFWHTIGNKFLTFLSNIVTNLNLTDMETCYKMIKTDLIRKFTLKENRFGFEPEVTIKLASIENTRFYEIGISYYGRSYQEGKKINWKDGFRAIYCIVKYGIILKKRIR